MLDHIYRIVTGFEQEHGVLPNLLYLSPMHYQYLCSAFDEKYTRSTIIELLNMDIIIETDRIHPHAAWIMPRQQLAS